MPQGTALLNFTSTLLGGELLENPRFHGGVAGWSPIGGRGALLPSPGLLRFLRAGDIIVNGAFPTDVSGWLEGGLGTLTWEAGRARLTPDGAGINLMQQDVEDNYVYRDQWRIGVRYRISFDVVTNGGNNGAVRVGSQAGSSLDLLSETGLTTGSHTFDFYYSVPLAEGPLMHVSLLNTIVTGYTEFDNIVLRELDVATAVRQTVLRKPGAYRLRVSVASVAGGSVTVKLSSGGTDLVDATISSPGSTDYDVTTGSSDIVVTVGRSADAVAAGVSEISLRPFEQSSAQAQVAVTGQAAIAAGAFMEAWVHNGDSTADHSADEHRSERLQVRCGDLVAGTGFTVHGQIRDGAALGQYKARWAWAA